MGEATLVEWLMGQAPLVIVLGWGIWYFKSMYNEALQRADKINEAANKRIDELNDEKSNLARDVVKITVLWEQKYNLDNENSQEIKKLLVEIREAVYKK